MLVYLHWLDAACQRSFHISYLTGDRGEELPWPGDGAEDTGVTQVLSAKLQRISRADGDDFPESFRVNTVDEVRVSCCILRTVEMKPPLQPNAPLNCML